MRKTKFLVIGTLSCLLMLGCSSGEELPLLNGEKPGQQAEEDPEDNLFDDVLDDGEPQAIVIRSMATDAVSVTKGTGTVGSMTMTGSDELSDAGDYRPDDYGWQYEDIYVLMTTEEALYSDDIAKGWGYASINLPNSPMPSLGKGCQFDNSFWCRPETDGEGNYIVNYVKDPRAEGAMRYYPMSGKSNFFAYYADDSSTEQDEHSSPKLKWDNNSAPTKLTLNFKIDGSQDLLSGYASADYRGTTVRKFDAKSARAGVVPVLGMDHMLTRFRFFLTTSDLNNTGNSEAFGVPGKSSAVTIEAIKVKSPHSEGTMTVACKELADYPVADNRISWKDNTQELLSLKQLSGIPADIDNGKHPLIDLVPVTMTKDVYWSETQHRYVPQRIGEALLVEPNQTEYELYLYTSQTLNLSGDPFVKKECLELTIKSSDIPKFLRGSSYDVTIYVNSYQEVKIQIELQKWETGGGIVIGGDDLD